MKTLKDLVLKELSERTQQELAREIGVSQGTISNASTGIVPRKLEVLQKFADYFHVSIEELRGGTASARKVSPPGFREVPVINRAACGRWRDFSDLDYPASHAERHELAPSTDPAAFYVIASGDSMIGAKIEEGDLLLVEPNKEVRDGQIVLARADHGCTVKKFFRHDGYIELRPMNESHKSLIVKNDSSLRIYRITRVVKSV